MEAAEPSVEAGFGAGDKLSSLIRRRWPGRHRCRSSCGRLIQPVLVPGGEASGHPLGGRRRDLQPAELLALTGAPLYLSPSARRPLPAAPPPGIVFLAASAGICISC
ncbi:unnamed protein product [Urochloa humidicola]